MKLYLEKSHCSISPLEKIFPTAKPVRAIFKCQQFPSVFGQPCRSADTYLLRGQIPFASIKVSCVDVKYGHVIVTNWRGEDGGREDCQVYSGWFVDSYDATSFFVQLDVHLLQ